MRFLAIDGQIDAGLDRNGNPSQATGSIVVSIDGLPEIFRLSAGLSCQIELLRYVPNRRKLTTDSSGNRVYIKVGSGLRHPSTDGAGSGSGGTRGGSINGLGPGVVRQTEWPVFGLPFGGSIVLPVATVFLPYFQPFKIQDRAGGAIQALCYFFKNNQRRPVGNAVKGYNFPPIVGVFAFRFSAFDPSSQRWVNGPISEKVFAFPLRTPIQPQSPGNYPVLNLVSPVPSAENLILTAQVGSRIR